MFLKGLLHTSYIRAFWKDLKSNFTAIKKWAAKLNFLAQTFIPFYDHMHSITSYIMLNHLLTNIV